MSLLNQWKLTHIAFCGIGEVLDEGDETFIRDAAATWIEEKRRKGLEATRLNDNEWEVQADQETQAMVGDDEGYLKIKPPITRECNFCGCEFTPETLSDYSCSPCCAAAYHGGSCECEACSETEEDAA